MVIFGLDEAIISLGYLFILQSIYLLLIEESIFRCLIDSIAQTSNASKFNLQIEFYFCITDRRDHKWTKLASAGCVK